MLYWYSEIINLKKKSPGGFGFSCFPNPNPIPDIFIRSFLRESDVDNHMFIGWINYIILIRHIENFVYFAVFSVFVCTKVY